MSSERGRGVPSEETPLEAVAAGVVTVLTLTVGFGLLAVGYPFFWVAFPIGFGGGMPLAIGLARWYQSREEQSGGDDPLGRDEEALARLRERYARGELTDEEFERQVSRLLETESVVDAREFADRRAESADDTGADERERAGGPNS